MTQLQIVKAIKTLDKIKGQALPLPLSYKLYKLRQSIQPHWDWQAEQERALMDKYSEKTNAGFVISKDNRLLY